MLFHTFYTLLSFPRDSDISKSQQESSRGDLVTGHQADNVCWHFARRGAALWWSMRGSETSTELTRSSHRLHNFLFSLKFKCNRNFAHFPWLMRISSLCLTPSLRVSPPQAFSVRAEYLDVVTPVIICPILWSSRSSALSPDTRRLSWVSGAGCHAPGSPGSLLSSVCSVNTWASTALLCLMFMSWCC